MSAAPPASYYIRVLASCMLPPSCKATYSCCQLEVKPHTRGTRHEENLPRGRGHHCLGFCRTGLETPWPAAIDPAAHW